MNEVLDDLITQAEKLINEKERTETQLVRALPSTIRHRAADIQQRIGILGKHPGDRKRADIAKKMLDFALLLAQLSTDHAKLGVLCHQLFVQAYQTMEDMDSDLPQAIRPRGIANSQKIMDIIERTQEEAVVAFGEHGLVQIMKSLQGK
jgi:hypothetical protein